jgi:hypothetical protein
VIYQDCVIATGSFLVLIVSSPRLQVTEESFPKGIIVDIADCGHNVPSEKFEDLVKELLTFHRDVTDTLK